MASQSTFYNDTTEDLDGYLLPIFQHSLLRGQVESPRCLIARDAEVRLLDARGDLSSHCLQQCVHEQGVALCWDIVL